jgi:3D (Asp-Asp-Asp) domain-containing protein
MRAITAFLIVVLFSPICSAQSKTMTFEAKAYCQKGQTASGTISHVGTVAADPAILPLGSRIRVIGAGKHSGEYEVTDTGSKVKGKQIDIFLRTEDEARQFGKKIVKVKILKLGKRKNASASVPITR